MFLFRRIAGLTLWFLAVTVAAVAEEPAPAELRVPAFTAYCEPDPNAVRVSEKDGVANWKDSKQRLAWFGEIKNPGTLELALSLSVPKDQRVKLRLSCAEKTFDVLVEGKEGVQRVPFGSVPISKAGYVSFKLEGLERSHGAFGTLDALLLSGPAIKDAHFNLMPRRNAASVHLGYPLAKDEKIEWFYNELTAREDPLWSYFMACGFSRGYFGIQVNSPTERRVIFSVWDSGNEAVSRAKVGAEDRVQLLKKEEGVVADDFGNEGTGGHSHLVYTWEKDKTYRFLVSAQPDGTHTVYTGYFYFPEKKAWA